MYFYNGPLNALFTAIMATLSYINIMHIFFMSACTKRQDILEIYSANLQK